MITSGDPSSLPPPHPHPSPLSSLSTHTCTHLSSLPHTPMHPPTVPPGRFTDTTEVLQEEVMEFVNVIAHIVHSTVANHGGAANKNIGDAFLLVWKFPKSFGMGDILRLPRPGGVGGQQSRGASAGAAATAGPLLTAASRGSSSHENEVAGQQAVSHCADAFCTSGAGGQGCGHSG